MPTRQNEALDFDYLSANTSLRIPEQILAGFVAEAQTEFPHDEMLAELHVLRAMKAYARKSQQQNAA